MAATGIESRSWEPVARSPLAERLASCAAQFGRLGTWEVALRFPGDTIFDPRDPAVAVTDLSFLPKRAFYGHDAPLLIARALDARASNGLAGGEVVQLGSGRGLLCALHAREALLIGADQISTAALSAAAVYAVDCTGAFGSLGLVGGSAVKMLRRLTTLDLSESAFPTGSCAQTKVAEVRGLVLHVQCNYYQLHVDRADAEHVWDALFSAGREFGIRPIGWEAFQPTAGGDA